jgi:putative oxidoreductase
LFFLYYGYPKIAHGLAGPQQYMVSVGLPSYFAYIAVALEVGGGVLLVLGLATRPVALLLAVEMGVALWKVDMVHGIKAVPDYQFALACGASALALASFGAGSISLDHAFFGRSSKPRPKPKA